MAVLTRPCPEFPCLRRACRSAASRNGLILKSTCAAIKTQLCTIAISLSLFNTTRLPREAFRYGAIPYLVIYSVWLLVVGLATTLLQLATGQLSQQDSVGVWRAVPIFRGVGHIQLITSYISCVYNMLYLALAAAYMMWIGKDGFPLRACTKLQMTPDGYANKINASECFNSTFLSSLERDPQYLGVLAIIVFILWFFIPLLLFGLERSLKASLCILSPLTFIIAIVVITFLSKVTSLGSIILSCEQWTVFAEPYVWFSALVQALMTTQIFNGYLVSAGSTVYKHSDVRWVSVALIFYNILAGWLWILLWQSIGEEAVTDSSFLSMFVLIYQSSVVEGREKQWPILAFSLILVSGIITILILLYPIFDRLQRVTGDKWKVIAGIASAAGTCLTLAIMFRAFDVMRILDELIAPLLVVFTTTFQVIGFVFIYGCRSLRVDIEFLSGSKASRIWVVLWCITPFLIIASTGWWLRGILSDTWGQADTLWPLGGTFIGILIVMAIVAAIAVAKEEQFNLLSKIAAAFRPSRLWGPEDPTIRYNWMVQRYTAEHSSDDKESEASYSYPQHTSNKINDKIDWMEDPAYYQRNYNVYSTTNFIIPKENPYATYSVPKKKTKDESNFTSPNVCLAKTELDTRLDCNCNRHFTLNVPYLDKSELTTSL